MVGSKIISRGNLQASTILEVVISMVIIVVVFGIAMMIYTNVVRRSFSSEKEFAETEIKNALIVAAQSDQPISTTININGLRLEQSVKTYAANSKLIEIDLAAYDMNQQLLTKTSEVIIVK